MKKKLKLIMLIINMIALFFLFISYFQLTLLNQSILSGVYEAVATQEQFEDDVRVVGQMVVTSIGSVFINFVIVLLLVFFKDKDNNYPSILDR